MSAAARHSQVLLAVWRQRDPASPWLRRALVAALVLSAATALIWLPFAAGWRLVAGMVLLVLLGTWMGVAANLQEQNHPHAARCVPGQLRTLRHAALLGWALCMALSTLLMHAMLVPKGHWPLVLLINGFVAVFLVWSSRSVWLWLLLTILSPLLGSVAGHLAPLGRAIAELWAAHTGVFLLLSLLAQAALVAAAFEGGGARHQARYARRVLVRNAMRMHLEGKQGSAYVWGRPIEWVTRPFSLAFDAWQDRLLARADNRNPRNVMARAAIVLHGTQHWLYQVMTMIVVVVIVMLSFTIASSFAQLTWNTLLPGALGMGIGIASMGYNPSFSLPMMVWHSRREQALLCLLPAMPRGAALNRAVAAHQLRDGLVAWLLTSTALVALGTVADSVWLLCLPLAAMPITAFNLTRHFARMRAPHTMTALWPVLAFFVIAGLLYLLVQWVGVPLGLLAVAVPVLSAALLAVRWRALGSAPAALPAGRLS